jgi:cation-transporting ATPase I
MTATLARSNGAEVKVPRDPAAQATDARVLHSIAGRLRLHLPHWSGKGGKRLAAAIRHLPGVHKAEPNPVTGNVLIFFDPQQTGCEQLQAGLQTLHLDADAPAEPEHPHRQAHGTVIHEGSGRRRRARIPVRGLGRDPNLAGRVLKHLESAPGVHAQANPLTGSVVIDYDERLIHLEEVIAELADLSLPAKPGEDNPHHPLDPQPLIHGATRAIGASAGLAFVTVERLVAPGATGHPLAGFVAGLVNLFQSFPIVRDRLRRLVGDTGAAVVSHGIGIVALTAADIPLGLVLAAAEALLLLNVVTQRRAAWRRYESRLDASTTPVAGSVVRLEAGMRVPYDARVVEGTGTAFGGSGRLLTLEPGLKAPAGARLSGGPFVLELLKSEPAVVRPRPAPPATDAYKVYLRLAAPISFVYAAAAGLATGSLARGFEALMLLNPRPGTVSMEAANLGASGRALRAGLTFVGNRPRHVIRRPDVLLLDGPRLLSDGKEVERVLPLAAGMDADSVLTLAAAVAAVTGAPLGKALLVPDPLPAVDCGCDGRTASARVQGARYTLAVAGPAERRLLAGADERHAGLVLALFREDAPEPLGLIGMRPKLLPGIAHLVDVCRRHRVELAVLPGRDDHAARRIADRAGVPLLSVDDASEAIRSRQARGLLVAFASDGGHAAQAFADCDLAIGMVAGHSGYFPAQADVLAPDLIALADLIDTGARRDRVVRDGVLIATLSNVVGLALSLQGPIGIAAAFVPGYVAALATMGVSWLRLRGGDRPESALGYTPDPHPERWGRATLPGLFRAFQTSESGLTRAAAARRSRPRPHSLQREEFLAAIGHQLQSPTLSLLAGGACLTLVLGQPLNTLIISGMLSVSVLVALWREREVSRTRLAMQHLRDPQARVLRHGQVETVSASDVVPGDVLVLEAGDRVAADARIFAAEGLEVSEATVTNVTVPVVKGPNETSVVNRVLLEGSDVIVGSCRAIVVAVGQHTRLGATLAVMEVHAQKDGPVDTRLTRVLHRAMGLALTGGLVTMGSGLVFGYGTLLEMIGLGVTTALMTLPEGLTGLPGVGQAAAARRLARRNTLVRRLANIETLGRVDVACTGIIGALSEGRLSVCLIADHEREADVPGPLSAEFQQILLTGGLAAPQPHDPRCGLHPTDLPLVGAVCAAGSAADLDAVRETVVLFHPLRGYCAARVGGRLYVKGRPETVVPRCARGPEGELDEAGRSRLLERATELAGRGLRILLIAQGPAETAPDDPAGLTALGFVGLSDPLRASAAASVARCQEAGIRVVILTGDHLATARAVAQQLGLFDGQHTEAVSAASLRDLPPAELDRRLADVAVIARATPQDKVHVIDSLHRRGHTVAMVGEAVANAPAMRLADIGVAMGKSGTEATQHAADLVLADDDFAHLAEALIEGRSLWRNVRHATGLLVGGNAGELGLIAAVSCVGLGPPLTAAEMLLVSLLTDVLPSMAVMMRLPQQEALSHLAEEGPSGVDARLPGEILRRGTATAAASLGGYAWARGVAGPAEAGAVAFASLVGTQLAQTLDAAIAHRTLSRFSLAAIGGSAAALGLVLGVPPVREFFGLLMPSAQGWGAVAASSVAAVAINRTMKASGSLPATANAWFAAWKEEVGRVAGRLLPGPRAIPKPVAG